MPAMLPQRHSLQINTYLLHFVAECAFIQIRHRSLLWRNRVLCCRNEGRMVNCITIFVSKYYTFCSHIRAIDNARFCVSDCCHFGPSLCAHTAHELLCARARTRNSFRWIFIWIADITHHSDRSMYPRCCRPFHEYFVRAAQSPIYAWKVNAG